MQDGETGYSYPIASKVIDQRVGEWQFDERINANAEAIAAIEAIAPPDGLPMTVAGIQSELDNIQTELENQRNKINETESDLVDLRSGTDFLSKNILISAFQDKIPLKIYLEDRPTFAQMEQKIAATERVLAFDDIQNMGFVTGDWVDDYILTKEFTTEGWVKNYTSTEGFITEGEIVDYISGLGLVTGDWVEANARNSLVTRPDGLERTIEFWVGRYYRNNLDRKEDISELLSRIVAIEWDIENIIAGFPTITLPTAQEIMTSILPVDITLPKPNITKSFGVWLDNFYAGIMANRTDIMSNIGELQQYANCLKENNAFREFVKSMNGQMEAMRGEFKNISSDFWQFMNDIKSMTRGLSPETRLEIWDMLLDRLINGGSRVHYTERGKDIWGGDWEYKGLTKSFGTGSDEGLRLASLNISLESLNLHKCGEANLGWSPI